MKRLFWWLTNSLSIAVTVTVLVLVVAMLREVALAMRGPAAPPNVMAAREFVAQAFQWIGLLLITDLLVASRQLPQGFPCG